MTKNAKLTAVNNRDQIPQFSNETEEAEFWSTHSFGDGLLDQGGPDAAEADEVLPPTRPRTKPLAVRFDEHTIVRLKTLAERRNRGYHTLLREFVAERLYEEEKREGML